MKRLRVCAWLGPVAALVAWVAGQGALAQCPRVSTTADDVANVPAGSLRDCLVRANASASRDVITFEPSVGEIRLRGALPPLEDPGGLRIEGFPDAGVIIDGRDVPDIGGFDVRGDVELVGLTVRNFRGGGYGPGTAVFVRNDARVTVERCVITSNSGGGVLFQGLGGGQRIVDSVFSLNEVAGVRWYGPGTACHAPRSVVARNRFQDNNRLGVSADDVFVSFQGCVDVIDNRFEGNSYLAMRLAGESTDVRVEGNTFIGSGLGIFTGARDNVVRDNVFDHDAGIGVTIGDGQGSTDNRVVGNVFRTVGAGLGVYLYDRSSTTRLFHNTFIGYRTAAIRVDGLQLVDVRNNLFVDSVAGVLGPVGPGAIVDSNGFFGVPAPCVDCDAGNVIDAAPRFLKAPTDVRLEACGSGAVDRGVDLGAEQPLRGVDGGRFVGGAPDLGAFEAAPCPPDAGPEVDAGAGPEPDAGRRDAGAEVDGGQPERAFRVGCGCSSGPSGPWLWWGLALLARAGRRGR